MDIMCGIVGIINKNLEPINPKILSNMAATLNHRGPDGEGHFIESNLGLYHKRLSIIDLCHGQQPMTSHGNTIVFNGEIYNYIELRNDLIQKGYHFETTSDTEVILRMYEEYGRKMVELLNGMFAFIIYDKRKNSAFIARDHLGIKPLYYYFDEEHILFGSEIKAILNHPSVRAIPDYESLQEYVTFQFVLNGNTLFKDIKKVLPGHYMWIELDDFSIQHTKYWDMDFRTDTSHTESYFTEKLRWLLEDTIRMQLRSDVPLGTYLSGGMDSSLVTTLASNMLDGSIKSFTGAFKEGAEYDETEYARVVAKHSHTKMFLTYPTVNDFIDAMPKLIYHLDEPVAGPGIFPQYMVSKTAAENVKVILGGQGGDEIFGGYARYVIAYLEQAIKGAIFENNEEGEHIVSLRSILPNLPYLKQYIPLMRAFSKKGAYDDMDRRYFHLIDRRNGSFHLYHEDFQNEYDEVKIFNKFQKKFNYSDTSSYYNKMTHFDMFGSLPGLLQVEDRVSMAVSLESRVPLLDHRIVDMVASMPPAMKFKGAHMKYLLKKATGDLLPQTILERKDKMGFPVPLHLWAKNGAGDFIRDVLQSKSCRERGIFNTQEVDELIDSEREFGRSLWGILSLELWYQQFIDGNTSSLGTHNHSLQTTEVNC